MQMANPEYDPKAFDDLQDLALKATNFARVLNHLANEMDLEHGKVACRGSWIDLIELAEFAAFELDECAGEAIETLTEWGNAERTAMAQGHPDPYRERFDQRQQSAPPKECQDQGQ
jgi:hypothetical protein